MTTFAETGMITYRTRLMEFARAQRFAACLERNRRFAGVEVRESRRAKGAARWYVCFLPKNEVRVEAMLDRQQDQRTERAITQVFTVVQDPDHDYLHVYSHATQETYEVSVAGATCSCPDFQYRLGSTGILCKHLIAASQAIRSGQVGEFEKVPAKPERVYQTTPNANLCSACAAEFGLSNRGRPRSEAPCEQCQAREERRRAEQARFAAIFGDNEDWRR